MRIRLSAVHRHPGGAVRLVDVAAGRQRRAAVEHADIVEAEKAALEDVAALGVLAVHPPGEVQHQLVEHALQEGEVAARRRARRGRSRTRASRPGMHRRVDVAEFPFVGRQLTVRVHVPFARQQHELLLGEVRIDQRQGDAVKREVPGGVPRILPLVRHRDDVGVVEVPPVARCARARARRRRRLHRVAVQPLRGRRSGKTASTTACRRAPGAAPSALRHRRCRAAAPRRTRRPRAMRRVEQASKSSNGSAASSSGRQPQPHHALSPRAAR